jgi:solute carrier family 25 carnitine/acylcarnitine transporter 20/29
MKRMFTNQNKAKGRLDSSLTNGQFYLAGMAAGSANGILACPIEHIRIRLQTQATGPLLYNGPIDCIRKINAAGGFTGLFRGFFPTLVREGHGMGAYFLTFEALVHREMKKHNVARADIPGWKLCLFGACAGYSVSNTIAQIELSWRQALIIVANPLTTDVVHSLPY